MQIGRGQEMMLPATTKTSIRFPPRGRILFMIDGLGMGGAERLMAPTLAALRATGFDTRVCVFQVRHGNPAGIALRAEGIPVDHVPLGRLRNLRQVTEVYAYVRRLGCDVIHTQLEAASIFGPLIAHRLGIAAFCTLHTVEEPVGSARRRAALMRWVLANYCERILCVSEHVRQHQIERWRHHPERLLTLHNGVDLAALRSNGDKPRHELRRDLGLPADVPVITTVAVLRPPKGIEAMISAMPSILRHVPETRYLVVGDGPHKVVLEALAEKIGVAHRVIFAGLRTDVADILAASDLFVLPSLNDALPTVLIEAMAAGLPIVATSIGGIPEMVAPQVNGLLVPPGAPDALAQACCQLIRSPDRARRLGVQGRRIAEQRFDIKIHAGRLAALYDKQIAQRLARPCALS
jgi:glycosyltransferase involved in cell wall biosynthesis